MVVAALLTVAVAGSALAATQNEIQKLLAGDTEAGDFFGFAVAMVGDTALIAAEFDDDNGENAGAVYVFTRSGGVWTEQQKLTASDGAAEDFFGFAVALDGDTAVIGAWADDDNGSRSGSAYVFTRSAGVWTEQQKLTASDGEAFDQFGQAVDVDGNTAMIGSIQNDGDGAVYVYRRSAGVWTEQQKLTDNDGATSDAFGGRISLDGNTVFIASLLDDDNGSNSGAVYAFARSAGVWSEQQKLTASDGTATHGFGIGLSLDADTAMIGAELDDDNSNDAGAVYVFTRSAGVWTEEQKLLADDGAAGDQFGRGVALDGDTAVIGALLDDDNGSDSGSAYVWSRSGGIWTERHKLLASDGAADDFFSSSLALDGSTAIVGAQFDDDLGESTGSAFVFKWVTDVDIDILPKNDTNKIHLKFRPLIPVAILGSPTFDALQVKISTVRFGPDGAHAIPWLVVVHDVNHDGFTDLILVFRTQATGIQCGDTEAELTGESYAAESFAGTDSIVTVGCH